MSACISMDVHRNYFYKHYIKSLFEKPVQMQSIFLISAFEKPVSQVFVTSSVLQE